MSVPSPTGSTPTLSVHWHGSDRPDGRGRSTAPGRQCRRPVHLLVPRDQRAGMSWYHPHPHLATASQCLWTGGWLHHPRRHRGRAQAAYRSVRGAAPSSATPTSISAFGNLSYNGKAWPQRGASRRSTGHGTPSSRSTGRGTACRILIGSNSRSSTSRFPQEHLPAHRATTGDCYPRRYRPASHGTEPWERVDVLVNCTGLAKGQTVGLVDTNSGWTLLRLTGTGVAGDTLFTGTALPESARRSALTGPSSRTRPASRSGRSPSTG